MEKNFLVFGDPVELVLTRAESDGSMAVVRQTCLPGGGPPPHRHEHEDELFQIVSGRFAFYDGATDVWTELPAGEVKFAPKRHVHAFRNCGETVGVLQIIAVGGAIDTFLHGISRFQMPEQMQAMIDYSATFGITYPGLPAPTAAQEAELRAI